MSSHFSDLLSEFDAYGVEYLVVGAHALAAHGHIRATKDLDVWIRPDRANAARTFRALAAFGAPLHELTEEDLATPHLIFQIGVAPVRIDILTSIDGVEFNEAWESRAEGNFEGRKVTVLSRQHLIRNKRSTGRLQDLADIESLEQLGDE